MKKFSKLAITLLLALPLIAMSCKKDSDSNDNNDSGKKTGTFSIDGKSYTGGTTIEDNPSLGYYIVTCQSDEPYAFVQVSFQSKAEAEKGGSFEVEDYALTVESGTVNLGTHTHITADPTEDATISVSGRKITISNVTLESTSDKSDKTTINSASINF